MKKSGKVIEVQCKMTSEEFVVLKGSMVEMMDSAAIPASVAIRRKNAKISPDNILEEDELFKSPSYAAAFVFGTHANGQTELKMG